MARQPLWQCGRSHPHSAPCLARWVCAACNGTSAAPGAAHALADALRAVDDTAGRNEAAHSAGEGRQAPAIGAPAAEIAGADHLAVPTDIEARGLRQDGRSGQPGRTAGDQRQQPVAQPSHRDAPQKIAEAIRSAKSRVAATSRVANPLSSESNCAPQATPCQSGQTLSTLRAARREPADALAVSASPRNWPPKTGQRTCPQKPGLPKRRSQRECAGPPMAEPQAPSRCGRIKPAGRRYARSWSGLPQADETTPCSSARPPWPRVPVARGVDLS